MLLGLAAPLLAGAPAAAQNGLQTGAIPRNGASCGAVVLAEFSWPAARLASAALDRLLSDGFGCAVTRMAASPERAAQAVLDAAARGEAVIAAGLAPDALPADPRLRVGGPLFSGAREGFFMPDWMRVANPDIETLAAAARAADRFRTASGEKPQLWLCPEQWSCHAESLRVATGLGFDQAFELITPASGEALTASLVEAHLARRPWIGYFWTPSATAAENPLAALSVGAARLCAADGADCREPFASRPTVIAYGAPLDRRGSGAATVLRRFSISSEAAMEALAWRARTNASIEQTADFMLARFPELWRELLTGAPRTAFEQALSDRVTGAAE